MKKEMVIFHYQIRSIEGLLLESTFPKNPIRAHLEACPFPQSIIQLITSMDPGEQQTITLSSWQAYGPYEEFYIQQVPWEGPRPIESLRIGDFIGIISPNGREIQARLVDLDIEENYIVADFNHPLAGYDLIFDINLLDKE